MHADQLTSWTKKVDFSSAGGLWRNASGDEATLADIELLAGRVAATLERHAGEPRTMAVAASDPLLTAALVFGGWMARWCVALLPPHAPPEASAPLLARLRPALVVRAAGPLEPPTVETSAANGSPHEQGFEDWLLPTATAPSLERQWLAATAQGWHEDACALVLCTSGSTGAFKGVCHSLQNVVRSAELFVRHFEIARGDGGHLCCLAAPHVMSGVRSLMLPLTAGIEVSYLHDAAEQGLALVRRVFDSGAGYVLCGPHFIALSAHAAPWLVQLSRRPRALLVTGAALDEDARISVEQALDLPVANFYGLTETGGIVLADTIGAPRKGTLPAPCEGVRIVTRPLDNGAGDNATGDKGAGLAELGIAGPNLALGYVGETLARKDLFMTGDLVRATGDGGWSLQGRCDRAIKSATTNWLFPERLEDWLRRRTGIKDAVVKPERSLGRTVLQCWVDCGDAPAPPGLDELRAAIGHDLDPEYVPERLCYAVIERSGLGKVSSVKELDPR